MTSGLLRRLRPQDGVAMVVVMGSLLVISLSAGLLATTASQSNETAIKGSSSKQALAAAEAGLQVATQRYGLYRSALPATQCLAGTNGVSYVPATGSECPAVADTGELDGDASYSYVVSLPGASCKSAPGAVTSVTVNDRCITSTGSAGGVNRRVQTRLGTQSGAPFFDVAGLVGLESLTFVNSNDVYAGIGSNGTISVGNSVTIHGDATYRSPGGSVSVNNGGQITGAQVPRTEPFVLELDSEFETAKAATVHNNAALPASWITAAKEFRPPNGTTYTLPVKASGTTIYYFCGIYLDQSIDLRIPSGREVHIFVDSPTRSGSSCTSGGKVVFNNSVDVNSPSGVMGRASDLEFYIAGTGSNVEDLRFLNSVRVSALFYAPNSFVDVNNSITINGAIAAKSILINNSINFTWPDDARTDPGPGRRASWSGWFECRPKPDVSTDPESGC